jgi:hypothetical protein
LQSSLKEVQVGELMLPLDGHTPPNVLPRHYVASTLVVQVAGTASGNSGEMVDSWFGLGPVEFVEDLDGKLRLRTRFLNFSSAAVCVSVLESAVGGGERVTQVAGLRSPLSKQGGDELGVITSKAPAASGSFRSNPRVLVWIRRDLFIARRFTEVDCHPAREGERLPFPRLFRFSRDWWSWREGGKEICRKILAMALGGRGGYKKPPGREGGQAGADGVPRPQLKPQVARVKTLPSQHGSESAQNQGQMVLRQVG